MDMNELREKYGIAKSNNTGGKPQLTLKRDENGILWSYNAAGEKVGRVYEHGDTDTRKSAHIDEIEEI